ncbi:ribonuclease P protein subunit p20 [Hyla sarda]|uniref:ribonuclease P protein subunit p20 n=1 Tax=Hyla sarda TaxID=327740 RepID=UPI0024C2B2FE|nr:ribonuclease P protein subunit p20 [Hyla sarda]XP_056425936.1 ribonuclease P protein subunit p20 [Hyla sarda]XP_056425937.1 ribonuclease P protein subunit p20 [Hyla sarda]
MAEQTPPTHECPPTHRRRPAPRPPRGPNDIYVNTKTDFRAQLSRCRRLLESGGQKELRVHGLGLAIGRAINLALQLQLSMPETLLLSTSTSTVELTDDMEAEGGEDGEPGVRNRNNSAIHIRVYRAHEESAGV